jgi:hypothetical protein
MNVFRTLRFDLEELDALGLAMKHGDTLDAELRTRYTPTPKTRYHSQIQQVNAE